MASQKLTVAMREDIAHRVIDSQFKSVVDDGKRRLTAAGMRVYEAMYTKQQRMFMETHQWMFPHASFIIMHFETPSWRAVDVHFSKVLPLAFSHVSWETAEECIQKNPEYISWAGRVCSTSDCPSLSEVWQRVIDGRPRINDPLLFVELYQLRKLDMAVTKDNERRLELYSRVLSELRAFNTTKQVAEGWPEIIPFLPKLAVSSANVPAKSTAELNKLLHLGVNYGKKSQQESGYERQ